MTLASCGRTPSGATGPDVGLAPSAVVPVVDATPALALAPSSTASTMTSAPEAGPLSQPDVLGQPCKRVAETPPFPREVICKDGVVAGFYGLVDQIHLRSDTFASLHDVAMPDPTLRGARLRVSMRDHILFVNRVTCERCRRVQGWAFIGDVSRLAEQDLHTLACRLHGRDDADLRSAAGWSALFAKTAGRSQPECKVDAPFQ